MTTTTTTTSSGTTAPPNPNHHLFSTAPRWPSSRRSSNYSVNTSCSSPSSPNSFISSTASPPPDPSATAKQAGIPFSWEDLPGIPKTRKPDTRYSSSTTKSSKTTGLPLPPAGIRRNRESGGEGGRRDPFMAALLECSRDGGDGQGRVWKKVGRSVSERFSIASPISIYQFSCKRSCSVSDSLVFLPRSRRLSYDLINKTSG